MRGTMRWLAAVAWVALVAAGCGTEEGNGDDAGEVTDVRVPIPEPDARFIDIVTPEVVIEPGEEKMYCLYLDNEHGRVAINELISMQGRYGHHTVLLGTTQPRENGALVDCTKMTYEHIVPIIIPVELPAGKAFLLQEGVQFIFQFHYVNASDKPLLVRDVGRLEIVDEADVDMWVAPFSANSFELGIQPQIPTTVEFDCTFDEDLQLIYMGGHMHEQGSRYEIQIGPDTDELTSIYVADPWKPEYRDVPPVMTFFENPLPLPRGTVMRTTCEWLSTLDHTLEFPEEMCVTFGIVAGRQEQFSCVHGTQE